MKVKPLQIGNVPIGGKRPVFILGPCVIESEKFVRRMAKKIAEACASEDVDFIFKASYDKANRTSVRSFRGIDVREGCDILSNIGRELKIPVTTDVHSTAEAEIAGEKIDMLQIPAFLARQTVGRGLTDAITMDERIFYENAADRFEGGTPARVDGRNEFD